MIDGTVGTEKRNCKLAFKFRSSRFTEQRRNFCKYFFFFPCLLANKVCFCCCCCYKLEKTFVTCSETEDGDTSPPVLGGLERINLPSAAHSATG